MAEPLQRAHPATSPAVRGGSAAAAIAAAVLIVTPFTGRWEGKRLTPYQPLPGDKWTVCYGETRVEMRRYTDAECQALLNQALSSDYAPPVLACVPGIGANRYAFAAAIDAAYNAGPRRFCRSPMAAHFRAQRWAAGCRAFVGWVETFKGKWTRGLANRRRAVVKLCLQGGQ